VCGLGMHSRGQLLLDRRKLGTGAFLFVPLSDMLKPKFPWALRAVPTLK
jgi:hypothetical protein